MKNLSTEILTIIFTLLHHRQKVECMLVCRLWSNILRSGLDLETITVSIGRGSDPYERLMKKIEAKGDDYGKKCKQLVIQDNYEKRFLGSYASLARYFPNLSYLSLDAGALETNPNVQPLTDDEQAQLQSWRNQLQTIKIKYFGAWFLNVLGSGVFDSLATLELTPRGERFKHFSEIFKKLKNTPNLTKLILNDIVVDVVDFEELHANLLNLESLTLKMSTISCENGLPNDIRSVCNLKTFQFIDPFPPFPLPAAVMQYLALKYNSVERFVLSEVYCVLKTDFDRISNEATTLLHTMGQNLTHLELEVPSKIPRALDLFRTVNLEGLKYLATSLYLSKRLLQKIVTLNGLQNVQTLKLSQVPPLHFSIFKRLKELKALELNFKEKSCAKYRVELNTVINHYLPSNLETLGLGYVELDINSNKEELLPSNLKQLLLKRSELSDNLADFITQHVKKLNTLFLLDCKIGLVKREGWRVISSKGKPCFELPEHRLALVNIKLDRRYSYKLSARSYREDYRIPTALKLTVDDNNPHCYNDCKGCCPHWSELFLDEGLKLRHDRTLQKIRKPDSYDSSIKYFEFKCANAQTIYFNGCLVF